MLRPVHLSGLVLLGVLTAFAPMGACSNDGRTLAPVDPDYTTTSGTPVIDAGPEVSSAGSFRLASEGFAAGAELPAQFTCAGAGVSPSLAWSEAPGGAELAVVMRERDSVASVHWIVTGMDPALLGFGDGGVPEGAELQVNAAGETAYLPPCPPAGSGTHLYDIVLHVLDEPLSFDPALRAPDLAATIETASRAEAPLTATVNA